MPRSGWHYSKFGKSKFYFFFFSRVLEKLEKGKADLTANSSWNELPFLAYMQRENLNQIKKEIEDIQAKKTEVPIYNGDPNTGHVRYYIG